MDISEVLPIILVIVGLIVIQWLLRRGQPTVSSHQRIVQSVISDVRINLRLIDVLMDGEQIKRFASNGWNMHKNRLDFLQQDIQTALNDAFEIAEEYNGQAATNKTYQSTDYAVNIDTVKMKEKFVKSKAGLEDWLMKNIGTTDPGGKSGMFDILFGRR